MEPMVVDWLKEGRLASRKLEVAALANLQTDRKLQMNTSLKAYIHLAICEYICSKFHQGFKLEKLFKGFDTFTIGISRHGVISRIRLFIKGKKHGRMMLDSIDIVSLVYPTIEENGQIRTKKYSELTEAQQLQDDCDVQETNILLHGLPPYVMTMQQVQVNTKFLNALPSEWSKFVTDVKLARSLYTTNYDQSYAYLSQHERHAQEFPQHSDSTLAVPMFQQGEDLIECINKVMAFLSAMAFKFLQSNNQLRIGNATTSKGNYAAGQPRVMKCYNCQGEGNTARQCTQPKRPRNTTWFKEKLMLAEAQEAGQILDEEQLAFLVDLEINEASFAQQTIPQNSAFQTEDLDTHDSDCDDLSSAKAVLMANLSSYDPDILSEVPYTDSYPNDIVNQNVQKMTYSQHTHIVNFPDNEINSDSNIIPYSQYLQEKQDGDKENQTNKMVTESLTAELERYKERVTIFEQRINADLNNREKLIASQMDDAILKRNEKFAALQQKINTLKETLSNNVTEKESLSKTLTVFKTEAKEKESKYIEKEIVLEKQNKELEKIIYKMYQSAQEMYITWL
ncbi:hypothetical protein Tco_0537843 [Tanacetum coccineum]